MGKSRVLYGNNKILTSELGRLFKNNSIKIPIFVEYVHTSIYACYETEYNISPKCV